MPNKPERTAGRGNQAILQTESKTAKALPRRRTVRLEGKAAEPAELLGFAVGLTHSLSFSLLQGFEPLSLQIQPMDTLVSPAVEPLDDIY